VPIIRLGGLPVLKARTIFVPHLQWQEFERMTVIPGTCVQHPGRQGEDALGDTSTPGTPDGSIANRARGHVQRRCRVEGNVWREEGCRRRHHSGGGPPALRDAHGRGGHPAAWRTCARRARRTTRCTGERVGSTAARRGACNRTGR